VLTPAGKRFRRIVVPVDYRTRWVSATASVRRTSESTPRSFGPIEPVFIAAFGQNLLYSDLRLAVLEVPGVGVGDVIEYEVRTEREALDLDWRLDAEVPVVSSRFELELLAGAAVQWGVSGRGHLDRSARPTSDGGGGALRWTWREHDLEAAPPEAARHLRLAPARTWSQLGDDYRELVRGLETAPPEALGELADFERRNPGLSPEEAAFRYVRDEIRYVAVEIGIGGLRPHPPKEVLLRRYGDCKDMAMLLVGLYQARGIPAHLTLISTRHHGVLDPDLPSLAFFDHAIVALPSEHGYRFADPTDKEGHLGQLGREIDGQLGLVITASAAQLVPAYGESKGVRRR
jgi:transglutaminase-like putative cysteine protease